MDLFKKIEMYIDYNNSYSLRKALTTLNREFNLAISKKNQAYANSVVDTTKKLYDRFSLTYRESEDYGETMSYHQKVFAKKMRGFISHLIKQIKFEFGGSEKYEQEIEQAIDGK